MDEHPSKRILVKRPKAAAVNPSVAKISAGLAMML